MEELISPWQEVKTPPQPTTNTVGSFPTVCVCRGRAAAAGVTLFPRGSYLFRSLLVFFLFFSASPPRLSSHTLRQTLVSLLQRSTEAPQPRGESWESGCCWIHLPAGDFVTAPFVTSRCCDEKTDTSQQRWEAKQTLVLKLTRAETKSKSRKLELGRGARIFFFLKIATHWFKRISESTDSYVNISSLEATWLDLQVI